MIPTLPGICRFCAMGLPHPLDVPELLWHELQEALAPRDD